MRLDYDLDRFLAICDQLKAFDNVVKGKPVCNQIINRNISRVYQLYRFNNIRRTAVVGRENGDFFHPEIIDGNDYFPVRCGNGEQYNNAAFINAAPGLLQS